MIEQNEHGNLIRAMLPQLLIAMIKEHGGIYKINASVIDDTSQDLLLFRIDLDTRDFIFEIRKKS